MRRAVLAAGTVAVVVAATLIAVRLSSGTGHLADPGCPSDAPVMAFNTSVAAHTDDVAVLARDGGVRRLTDDHRSWDPSFSPDGDEVAFTRGKGSFSDELGWEGAAIYVMDSDGDRERPLLEEPPATFASAYGGGRSWDTEPVWSPDGNSIAFVRGNGQLVIADPTDGDPEVLHEETGMTTIAWSPDSSMIAFTDKFGDGGISIVDAAAGSVIKRIEDVGAGENITWSPDGTTLAFDSYPDTAIFTIDYEEFRHPDLFVQGGYAPSWSPDGTHLAYLSHDAEDNEDRLFTKALGATEETEVDTGSNFSFGMEYDLEWVRCPPSD